MTRMVLPDLEAKGRGAIINISSVGGSSPQPMIEVYAGSKAYVDYLSLGMSGQCARKGTQITNQIHLNAYVWFSGVTIQDITPAYVVTDMAKAHGEHVKESFFMPNPIRYSSHALSTLGFSNKTCGYWTHSLQMALGNLFCKLNHLVIKMIFKILSEN